MVSVKRVLHSHKVCILGKFIKDYHTRINSTGSGQSLALLLHPKLVTEKVMVAITPLDVDATLFVVGKLHIP